MNSRLQHISGDVTYFFEVIPVEIQLAVTHDDSNATFSFLTQEGLTYQLESASFIPGRSLWL